MRIIMVQDVEKRNKSYNQYVENVTKKAGCVYNCFKAFITGGIICTIGQLIMNLMKMTGMTADDAASYTTLILVALSVIFTGFGIYPLITSFGQNPSPAPAGKKTKQPIELSAKQVLSCMKIYYLPYAYSVKVSKVRINSVTIL